MRVCIDVRFGLASGASTYMTNLVNALIDARSDHEIVLLGLNGSKSLTDRQVESISCPPLSPLKQYWWVQRHLADRLRSARIDIYHSLKHLGPFKSDCKQIYSMSSLGGYVGYRSHATHGARLLAIFRSPMAATARLADHLRIVHRGAYRFSIPLSGRSHFLHPFRERPVFFTRLER
jgi:hypothetical protein